MLVHFGEDEFCDSDYERVRFVPKVFWWSALGALLLWVVAWAYFAGVTL